MTPKMTQKNYEAIKIYKQKEKIFELKGKIQTLLDENAKLKDLLKDCSYEADGALRAIQNDCENEEFSIFYYPEVQSFYLLQNKINKELEK